jgi:beta-phosphoglucomutase-like phosphatase (HAD superfamily)
MILFFFLVTMRLLSHSESFPAVPSVPSMSRTAARSPWTFSSRIRSQSIHTRPRRASRLGVRNIDLCEAIIFYGSDCLLEPDSNNLLPGVENLVRDCQRDGTVVLVLWESQDETLTTTVNPLPPPSLPKTIQVHRQTQPPPNPRDVWEAIHHHSIVPKGFGGSSGFGTKASDPERAPLPQHTVVLCDTADKCRAARYAGMRVVCLFDNDFADAIVDAWDDIKVDDIATPGSFWLNPPHAKDDEGNGVDPQAIMRAYEQQQQQGNNHVSQEEEDSIMNDDQIAAILADMDSL